MPDLILFNGQISTQDPALPQATALAIQHNRIWAVGTDADILALARPHTQTIRLNGRRVLPGLTDAHFHFYDWAMLRQQVILTETTSLAKVQQKVEQAVAEAKPGQWILGQGWNQDRWAVPQLPNRSNLDTVAPDNPVLLYRTDLHLVWANSKALELAGITAATPDPEMGIIERDEQGHPTGILRELAINLARQAVPEPTPVDIDQAVTEAIAAAHQLGLTGIHDMRIMGGEDGLPAFTVWQRLRAANRLKLRMWMMLPGEKLDEILALGLRTGLGDEYLRIGGIKLFADGALGPRTAWMLEPFADAGTGLPLMPMGRIADIVTRAHQGGLSAVIHAIGDRAIRELLDVFAEMLPQQTGSPPLAPHRIEHVQHSHPDDLKRLGNLGLAASVQPIHATDDMAVIDRVCGERGQWAYAFRDVLNAGAPLALGSDCPVASPNPFWGIHAAVTRQRPDGTPSGGWHPAQRLSVAEAVWGYTVGAAQASGQTASQGSLTPGKLADVIVLDRDIFAIPAADIRDTRVQLTIFDGEIVYRTTGL